MRPNLIIIPTYCICNLQRPYCKILSTQFGVPALTCKQHPTKLQIREADLTKGPRIWHLYIHTFINVFCIIIFYSPEKIFFFGVFRMKEKKAKKIFFFQHPSFFFFFLVRFPPPPLFFVEKTA